MELGRGQENTSYEEVERGKDISLAYFICLVDSAKRKKKKRKKKIKKKRKKKKTKNKKK